MKATDPKPEEQASTASSDAKLLEPKSVAQPAGPKPEGKIPPSKADTKPASSPAEPKPEVKTARARTDFRNKIIIALAICGILAGLVAAYYFGLERKAQPPVFKPVSSPYESAIYANGIIESDQPSGSNITIYPEISGPVIQVLVHEGQVVSAGTPLLAIDDSVQKAITAELGLQAEASLALLDELKAQPRKETLAIAEAQVGLAEANLKVARNQYGKRRASFDIDPKSISQDVLDTADDAVTQAAAGLDVARRQFELIRAGAWNYDLANQQKQYDALKQAYQAASALLQKYSVKAQVNGIILALNTTVGSTVSPLGAYNAYTQGFDPLLVMSAPQDYLAVRCYIDEILVSRLPSTWHIRAEMTVRGTEIKVPLEFVRVQPYLSPKIELSNQRQEKVDLRVLPVIFRFQKQDAPVYPGQLVDVYIGQK